MKELLLAVSNHVTFFNKLEKLKFQHNVNNTKDIFLGFCPSSDTSSCVGRASWSALSINKVQSVLLQWLVEHTGFNQICISLITWYLKWMRAPDAAGMGLSLNVGQR